MKRWMIVTTLALAAGIAGVLSWGGTTSASTTVVVKPSAMNGWEIANFQASDASEVGSATTDSGTFGDFVTGPGTPPEGDGSYHQVVGTNGDDANRVRTSDYNGVALADITAFSYSTYVTANNGGQATYIQLRIDQDGNGSQDDRLFFEPVYQNGTYGTLGYSGPVPNQCGSNPACVDLATWQGWDALSGGWWSENDSAGGPPLTTLAGYAANYPGSLIVTDSAGVRVQVGGGAGAWDNFDGNVDALTITETTNSTDTLWDFEPDTPCTTVCYVDAATGDDSFDGDTPATAKKTIQAAIATVSPGGTVIVASGTYVESGQIVINKDMTITGESGSKPVVKPAQNTGGSGDARGWFLVTSGTDLTLEHFVLDGSGWNIYQAIRSRGNGTIDDVDFENIKFSQYVGFGVALFDDMTVSDSTFSDIERVGVIAFGTDVDNAIIEESTFTGKGAGDWLDYAVEVGGGAKATITDNFIEDNTGVALSDGSTSAGVLATTFFGAGTEATLTGNTITGSTEAIAVGFDGSDTSTVVANYNDFSGNAGGVSSTAPTVDAAANWWGSDTGPTHTLNVGGAGVSASDDVVYSPWLGFGTDDSPDIGFQVVSPMTWIVGPAVCGATCIQAAVDFSDDGDTIKSKTGVFTENVTINKDVTVTQASTPVVDGGGGAFAVKITADGATLDGYEVRNAVDGVVIDSGADNVTVTDNNIHTFTSAGLRATFSTGDDLSSNLITGPHTASCSGGFWGMRLTDTSGDIDLNTISGIGNGTVIGGGCQEGRAIEATGSGTLQITNNDISQYQKSGIIVRDALNTTISNNTTAGDGPTAEIAMNGITVTSTGTTTIDGNHTSGHRYTPESDVSCGILTFNTVTITGNDSTADEVGICAIGGNGSSVTLNEIDQHTQQGIMVDGALNILVDDNDIDGAGSGTTANGGTIPGGPDTDTRYYGVFVVGSTGTVSDNDITGITHGPSNGTQSGVAIRVTARTGETSDVDITGNTLTNYQKNGFVITNVYGGVSVNADLVGNTVTGAGPISYIAQNGIQYSGGATGSVTGSNNVSGHDYTPPGTAAVGVLLIGSGPVNVNGNQIHDNMEGVYIQDADNVDVDGNVFTNNRDTSVVVFNSSNGGYHFNTFNGQPDSYGMYLADAAHNNEIQGNDFLGNEYGIVVDYSGAGEPLGTEIHGNDFIGNTTFGVEQTGTLVGPVVDAEDNWWNACDGPSGAGPGSGDAVSTNVDFTPFEHGACDSDNDLLTDDSEDLIYLTDYLDPDTDGDGCADGEEILFPVAFGGGRNPLFVWDFYDVNASKKVDAADIALVRAHYNPSGPVPPLDMTYDRSPGAGMHAPGAPDNKINAVDIALVRASFNDNCQAPPP